MEGIIFSNSYQNAAASRSRQSLPAARRAAPTAQDDSSRLPPSLHHRSYRRQFAVTPILIPVVILCSHRQAMKKHAQYTEEQN
jgi:hypothetical protein